MENLIYIRKNKKIHSFNKLLNGFFRILKINKVKFKIILIQII
jgi:hypothetical protein